MKRPAAADAIRRFYLLLLTIFIVPPLVDGAAGCWVRSHRTNQWRCLSGDHHCGRFAAWNTGNNLLFLVFSLLCSTLFVGWVAAETSLQGSHRSARFPTTFLPAMQLR
jgi:hypothetical protein